MIGFVTGLPRSRTHWFAEYFAGYVPSYHEPMNFADSKQAFYDLVQSGCVVSDSGLFLTDFQDRWDIPTVIIERPIEHVYFSLCAYFEKQQQPAPSWSFLKKQKAEVDKLKGLRIPYNEVNERLEEISDYFLIPFNKEWAEKMIGKNSQLEELKTSPNNYMVWDKFREMVA